MKRLLSLFLILTVALSALSGCSTQKTTEEEGSGFTAERENMIPVTADFTKADTDMFSDRDSQTEYNPSNAVTIQLKGDSATASSDSVIINGSKITVTQEATYVISGELSDGMLIVDADEKAKLQLVFSGVNITSKSSAALYVLKADKVFVTLAEKTSNTLTNGGTFTSINDNNIDAALFSKEDLTLNGTGSLQVVSPTGHGIVCKDDLVFADGIYTIKSSSHGLDANDSIRIKNADLTIDAGKDAIHAENKEDATKGFVYISSGTVQGEAEGDGITASAYLQIANGKIDLTIGGGYENGTKANSGNYGGFMGGAPGGMVAPPDGMGGGKPGGMGGGRPNQFQTIAASSTSEDTVSMKGLKAKNTLMISGGVFTINSADDCVHSDTSVIIAGGTFHLSSGDDAIHAEEKLTVTAGEIEIKKSYEGLEALHIDVQGGNIKLTAKDDGLNAAGGTDGSGTSGGRDGMFGGMNGKRPGGMGGGMSANSNGSIKISGGTLSINASGDGLDANGTLEITGGHTTVVGPNQGDTATLDYDKTGTIKGGTFIGTGASGMAQSFQDSSQGVLAIRIEAQSANTQIVLKDSQGRDLITHTPELNFSFVILSSPEIIKGETYTLTVGTQTKTLKAS